MKTINQLSNNVMQQADGKIISDRRKDSDTHRAQQLIRATRYVESLASMYNWRPSSEADMAKLVRIWVRDISAINNDELNSRMRKIKRLIPHSLAKHQVGDFQKAIAYLVCAASTFKHGYRNVFSTNKTSSHRAIEDITAANRARIEHDNSALAKHTLKKLSGLFDA